MYIVCTGWGAEFVNNFETYQLGDLGASVSAHLYSGPTSSTTTFSQLVPNGCAAGYIGSSCGVCDTANGYGTPPSGGSACVQCPANSALTSGYCMCAPNYFVTSTGSCSLIPKVISMSLTSPFNLALDGAAAVWVWGTSPVFGGSVVGSGGGSFPKPTPLASAPILTSSAGVIGVPNTPAGAKIIAISAGQDCGCVVFSDTSAGCFGDTSSQNSYSNFVNAASNSFVTDGSGHVLTGIRQVIAPTGQQGGVVLLRDHGGMTGVVTYLSNTGAVGTILNSDYDVIDPLNPGQVLQGAVQVAQGVTQFCALMGSTYTPPNAIACVPRSSETLTTSPGPFVVATGAASYISASSFSMGLTIGCAIVGRLEVTCWGGDYTPGGVLNAEPVAGITCDATPYGGHPIVTTTYPSSDVVSIQSIACGGGHNCLLMTDTSNGAGVVRCWGYDGTQGANSISVYALNQDVLYSSGPLNGVALSHVTSLSGGWFSTCATLGADEAVTCELPRNVFDCYV